MLISLFAFDTTPDATDVLEGTWETFSAGLRRPLPADRPKRSLPMWSAATFTDGHRAAANVEAVHALPLDVDAAPIPSADDLRAALAGIRAVCVTSSSATATAPRWRVVLAISRPVTADEYRRLWAVVTGALPFAVGQEAKDPSRAWYVSRRGADDSFDGFALDGEPIDVDALLALPEPRPTRAEALEWSERGPRAPSVLAGAPPPTEPAVPGARRAAAVTLLRAVWPPKGRHAAQLALAGGLARDGWTEADAVELLTDVAGERSKREATCRATWAARDEGKAFTGWAALAAVIGAGNVAAVRSLLDANADFLAELEVPKDARAAAPPASLPPFPLEALPPVLRDYVAAQAEATQTPIDLSAMLVLGACSGAIAGKLDVQCSRGWREPLNLYCVVAMPPGERKSACFAAAFGPLQEAERAKAESAEAKIADAELRRDQTAARLRKAKAELAKLGEADEASEWRAGQASNVPGGGVALKRKIGELEAQARAITVPARPQFLAEDVTMERLAGILAEQGGRVCLASAEGGTLFGIVGGRYSGSEGGFEVLLKGHAGDRLKVDRQSKDRPAVHVEKPCLTIALALQPSVIEGIKADSSMRGQGLLARFLYAYPASRVGERKIETDPVPDVVRAAYGSTVRTLAEVPTVEERGLGGTVPTLALSPEAYALHLGFQAEIEPRLHPVTGDLRGIGDWAAKWAGAVARIAGVLHCVEEGPSGAVAGATMAAAIQIGRYLLPHAQRAYGAVETPQSGADAEAILEWLRQQGATRFTASTLAASMRPFSLTRDPKRRTEALRELVALGKIEPDGAGWRRT